MYAGYYAAPRGVEETIELVGLGEKADERAERLSGGQQRRLDVGVALIGDPELLFLDEPTTGFDPSARRQVWDVVSGLRDLGKTVFLTTHYMDEAQALADRVAVIAAGRIVGTGTPDELGGRREAATEISFGLPDGVGPEQLPAAIAGAIAGGNGRLLINTAEPTAVLNDLTGWALERGVELELARGPPAEPRGRLPGADRATDELAGARRTPVPLRPEDLLAQPGRGLLHRDLPADLPLPLRRALRQRRDREPRGRGRDLLRARDHHPRGRLGDPGQPGDEPRDRPRGGPAEALPRYAAARLGVHRRPGRQLDRRLADDGRGRHRARRDLLRRRGADRDRCRRCS